jgi:predicted enzyme related to lactoylglutathione lyase
MLRVDLESRRFMHTSPSTGWPLWIVASLAMWSLSSLTACDRTVPLPPLAEQAGATQIPGKFVWHNLITADAEAARAFYGGLFGWEFESQKGGRYTVISHRGRNIGGIVDVRKDGHAPKAARWLSAMSVADLDASLAAVKEAGGKQLEAPVQVAGIGRVVTIEDADGAVLHLLASNGGDPPDTEPPVDTWLWHELLANHADRALDFYATAFGYRVKPLEKKPDAAYRVLWSAGEPRAGVIENPFETRSLWVPYVRVADPSALIDRVLALGGRVLIEPSPDVREGTLALVLDPSGAPLALQKWDPEWRLKR